MDVCFNERHNFSVRRPHSIQPGQVELSDELEREVCAIYAVDFACFGYELPASCR